MYRLVSCWLLTLALGAAAPPARADLAAALKAVRAVGPEGRGNAAATQAWRELAALDASRLPTVLAGMDGAGPLARNWLRAAVEAIAERTLQAGTRLPLEALETFLKERAHDGSARRLAFDLIAGVEPARAAGLVPGLLDDPANELRREAVQQALDQAAARRSAADDAGARARFSAALAAARDVDQIEVAAKALRELGEPVDLTKVFGWLTRWQVIGPFDNTGRAGFDTAFPPERELALDAELPGKRGTVRWRALVTTNDYGLVNFNEPFGPLKEVTAYAVADFDAAAPRPAEIRLGCKNAWKVWFNGRLLFGRDEYHRAMEIDQYRLPVELQAGRNRILVKVCQNEQTEDWTVEWEFQLRVTDAAGQPIAPSPTTAALAVPTPEAR